MKIALLADSAALTTGFGNVASRVVAGMVARGWEVHQITALDFGETDDTAERYARLGVVPHHPVKPDLIGFGIGADVIREVKPDALLIICDPGTAYHWSEVITGEHIDVPVVLYAPVEGAPVLPVYAEAFAWATRAFTMTRWSAERLKFEHGLDVDWVYHGVDLSVFKPLSTGDRLAVRRKLGWEGKFVVAYVARNVGRKHHDRLIKALSILQDQGDTDTLLYLHCQQFEGHQMQGWDLNWWAQVCGVWERVQFAAHGNGNRGEAATGLATKLAAADLYVHVAGVEGFGIPIIEAMASGLPVLVPADGGNMEEVAGDAACAKLRAIDYTTWFTGAQLCNLAPQHLAEVITTIKGDPKLRRAASVKGLERVNRPEFRWQHMTDRLCAALAEVAQVPQGAGV